MNNLALHYLDLGRLEEAEALQRDALATRRRLNGEDHPDTVAAMFNLATTLIALGRHDEQARLCEQVLAIESAKRGADHPMTLLAKVDLGNARRAQGRRQEAIMLLQDAHRGLSAVLGSGGSDTLTALRSLAETLAEAGRTEEARAATQSLLSARRRAAEGPAADAAAKNVYAWALLTCVPEELRNPEEAARFAHEASEATRHEDPNLLGTLALAQHRLGRSAEAVETVRRALALLPPGGSPLRTALAGHLAEFEAALEARPATDQ
jgi:tetratricopeptide (TPR) repeat protein